MATSDEIKLGLFNKACGLLGVVGSELLPEIQTIAEDTKGAKLCRMFIDDVRREVLRAHPWNCATINKDLGTADTETPMFDYDHQFLLPDGSAELGPKCLRVLCMEGWDGEDPPKWAVRLNEDGDAKVLMTDEDEAKVAYIHDLEDYTLLDDLLLEAIYTKLAWKIGPGMGAADTRVEKIWKEFEGIVQPNARTVDSQESSGDFYRSDTWLNARR
jgi:hypothetical protein